MSKETELTDQQILDDVLVLINRKFNRMDGVVKVDTTRTDLVSVVQLVLDQLEQQLNLANERKDRLKNVQAAASGL